MAHLSVSYIFLVLCLSRLQAYSPFLLSPLLSPPPQHLASLQPAIILALRVLCSETPLSFDETPSFNDFIKLAILLMWHHI